MNSRRKNLNPRKLVAAGALGVGLMSVVACSTSAAPETCVAAAEKAGAPEAVVEHLKRPPGDLNAVERIAVRKALEQFGLDNACEKFK